MRRCRSRHTCQRQQRLSCHRSRVVSRRLARASIRDLAVCVPLSRAGRRAPRGRVTRSRAPRTAAQACTTPPTVQARALPCVPVCLHPEETASASCSVPGKARQAYPARAGVHPAGTSPPNTYNTARAALTMTCACVRVCASSWATAAPRLERALGPGLHRVRAAVPVGPRPAELHGARSPAGQPALPLSPNCAAGVS